MSGASYLIQNDGSLVEMKEHEYDSELDGFKKIVEEPLKN
jgi:hypothetical protein